jgi:hypothetical protein
LGQALFLSSILPSPKRTYFGSNGQVTNGWAGYLRRLMKLMRERNRITDEELADGLSEVVTYRVARSPRTGRDDGRDGSGGTLPIIDGP